MERRVTLLTNLESGVVHLRHTSNERAQLLQPPEAYALATSRRRIVVERIRPRWFSRGLTLLFALVCDTLCAGALEDAKERAGDSHGHKDREPDTGDGTAFIDLDISATLFGC
jgi:hypothetical protein